MSLLLLEEVDEVADVPLWDCASVTVICSDVGALGAETGVNFGRAPVWWKADGGCCSSLLTLSASAWYSTLGLLTVAR